MNWIYFSFQWHWSADAVAVGFYVLLIECFNQLIVLLGCFVWYWYKVSHLVTLCCMESNYQVVLLIRDACALVWRLIFPIKNNQNLMSSILAHHVQPQPVHHCRIQGHNPTLPLNPVQSFGLHFAPCYTHLLQLFHHCSPTGGFWPASFGLPKFHLKDTLGILLLGILRTWPSYQSLRFLILRDIFIPSVFLNSSSLVILSSQ